MNTPVKFELAKLLKEQGYPFEFITVGELKKVPLNIPTIAKVCMWLYEKHEYWCYVYTNGKIWHPCIQHKFGDMAVLSGKIGEFNSPTEAYEAAIVYTLNNLL